MKLWLRYKKARHLEFDEEISVNSQEDWFHIIYNPNLVSSILWPDSDLFKINIRDKRRKHIHESDYKNNKKVNFSYLHSCKNIAEKLEKYFGGARCLVYAPLRGALPIWRCISQFVESIEVSVYYPVTSSFIFYPEEFGILGKRGRPASGRYNNRFELNRIFPFLKDYDFLFYVDEIVSGGMMLGHLKDMLQLKINQEISIVAIGLADVYGEKSKKNRQILEERYLQSKKLEAFLWEGCKSLITEDQKFLLCAHYVDYHLGPYEFDQGVYKSILQKGLIMVISSSH